MNISTTATATVAVCLFCLDEGPAHDPRSKCTSDSTRRESHPRDADSQGSGAACSAPTIHTYTDIYPCACHVVAHGACLEEWMCRVDECPICRRQLREAEEACDGSEGGDESLGQGETPAVWLPGTYTSRPTLFAQYLPALPPHRRYIYASSDVSEPMPPSTTPLPAGNADRASVHESLTRACEACLRCACSAVLLGYGAAFVVVATLSHVRGDDRRT